MKVASEPWLRKPRTGRPKARPTHRRKNRRVALPNPPTPRDCAARVTTVADRRLQRLRPVVTTTPSVVQANGLKRAAKYRGRASSYWSAPMKKVFTTGQVAKICKVAPRTVSKWFDSGRLKGYRIPGSQDRRIPREQLIKFLKEHGMPLGELEEEEWHKVLLIGTEKLFNDRLKELLSEDDDFKFELANSGFEAGTLAQSFHPDTIVIDLGLGRSESIQITGNLRKNDVYSGTLIIGLAGEDEAEPEKLKEYGFNDVFKKPFDTALLADNIRSIADAKRED